MSIKIACTTLHGDKKLIATNKIQFRPAAYGLITHEDTILLVNTRSTNKLFFPGGAIEKGETVETALKREVYEEAGIDIKITTLFKVHTNFFYYDPWDTAYQSIAILYRCQPQSLAVTNANNENGDEAEKPQWVKMAEVKPNDFQDWAGDVFAEFLAQEKAS